MMNEPEQHPQPLSAVIKQRRTRLGLTQQQIADALQVVPESIGYWERDRRRIELDRVPHLAAVLELDQQDVCRLALYEHYPQLHATLFGAERPPAPRPIETQ
jgi:transcriptional regulator with XRE-family HTH domain